MDVERNDGFHISTAGWNVRSFTGLQALDSIWRGLQTGASTIPIRPTGTPEASKFSSLLPTPLEGSSMDFTNDKIIFGLVSRHNDRYESQGVYLFDPITLTTSQLLGEDLTSNLLLRMGNPYWSTEIIFFTIQTAFPLNWSRINSLILEQEGALYLPENRIAVILKGIETNSLSILLTNGSKASEIETQESPVELFSSTDGAHLTWGSR